MSGQTNTKQNAIDDIAVTVLLGLNAAYSFVQTAMYSTPSLSLKMLIATSHGMGVTIMPVILLGEEIGKIRAAIRKYSEYKEAREELKELEKEFSKLFNEENAAYKAYMTAHEEYKKMDKASEKELKLKEMELKTLDNNYQLKIKKRQTKQLGLETKIKQAKKDKNEKYTDFKIALADAVVGGFAFLGILAFQIVTLLGMYGIIGATATIGAAIAIPILCLLTLYNVAKGIFELTRGHTKEAVMSFAVAGIMAAMTVGLSFMVLLASHPAFHIAALTIFGVIGAVTLGLFGMKAAHDYKTHMAKKPVAEENPQSAAAPAEAKAGSPETSVEATQAKTPGSLSSSSAFFSNIAKQGKKVLANMAPTCSFSF